MVAAGAPDADPGVHNVTWSRPAGGFGQISMPQMLIWPKSLQLSGFVTLCTPPATGAMAQDSAGPSRTISSVRVPFPARDLFAIRDNRTVVIHKAGRRRRCPLGPRRQLGVGQVVQALAPMLHRLHHTT